MLSDAAERHRDGLTKYADRADSDDSDTDNDSSSPVMDTFLESGGSKAVCDMTNFTLSEFSYLWAKIQNHVLSTWNVGRGRKSAQKPKDVLFMLLTVLKHAGKWDFLAKMFNMKAPTFEKLISS